MAINLHLHKAKTEWWLSLCSYSKRRFMNVYVLPNSKAAFRKKQATSKKKFLCLSDYVKEKRTTCSLLPAGKGCVWIEQFFCSNEQLKCLVSSLSYLLLHVSYAVLERRIGRNGYWKWIKFFVGTSQTGYSLNWVQIQK